MNISSYITLIQNLPVQEQCFTTKRNTWSEFENSRLWLKELNNQIFNLSNNVVISRKDLYEISDFKQLIVKTIYWGYPGGMRGNNFECILDSIDKIIEILFQLKEKRNPNETDFIDLKNEFAQIKGIGISTYSKILCFSKISFNGDPCLILDARLINIFNSRIFIEFEELKYIRYYNAENKYLTYLKTIHSLALQHRTNGENIEQFLYIFGNNLKENNL